MPQKIVFRTDTLFLTFTIIHTLWPGSLNIKFENPVVRISGIAEVALQMETPTGWDVHLPLDESKGYTEERGNTA